MIFVSSILISLNLFNCFRALNEALFYFPYGLLKKFSEIPEKLLSAFMKNLSKESFTKLKKLFCSAGILL